MGLCDILFFLVSLFAILLSRGHKQLVAWQVGRQSVSQAKEPIGQMRSKSENRARLREESDRFLRPSFLLSLFEGHYGMGHDGVRPWGALWLRPGKLHTFRGFVFISVRARGRDVVFTDSNVILQDCFTWDCLPLH